MHEIFHDYTDMRNMSLSRLTQEFGKMGQVFYDFSRGIDNRPVIRIFIKSPAVSLLTMCFLLKKRFCLWPNS